MVSAKALESVADVTGANFHHHLHLVVPALTSEVCMYVCMYDVKCECN